MAASRLDPEHLGQRVHDALALDPSVSEQGIQVTVEPGRVILSGELSSPERCASAIRVARATCPGMEVEDRLTITSTRSSARERGGGGPLERGPR